MNTKIKLLTIAALAGAALSANGAVIFTESFGTSDSGDALEDDTGLDNYNVGSISFESIGGADVRDSLASSTSDYAEASGGNNVFLSDNTEGFYIFGIDYSGQTSFTVEWGGFEGIGNFEGFDDTILDLAYTTDSTPSSSSTWTTIPFSGVDSGNGWQESKLVSDSVSASGSTLSLRFESTASNNIRLDDVSVTAVPEPSTYAALLGALALGFVVIRRRQRS